MLMLGTHTSSKRKQGFRASYNRFVVDSVVVLLLNFYDKIPPLLQVAKRYLQAKNALNQNCNFLDQKYN